MVAKQVRKLNNENDKTWMKEIEGNTKKYGKVSCLHIGRISIDK